MKLVKMSTGNKSQAQVDSSHWSALLSQLAIEPCEATFAQLHAHFAPQLRGFLLHHGGGLSLAIAEDISQEVMSKVWFKAASYDPSKASASTWIFTLCRNARIDYLRKISRSDMLTDSYDQYEEKHSLHADDIWELDNNQPFVDLVQHRDQEQMRKSLAALSEEQRQALHSSFIQGMSHSEIAEHLELPLGTVKSRVRLGLQRLQSLLTSTRGAS